MEFKPAQCPTCGGALQLPDNRSTVNCMYCGATVVVRDAIQAAAAATVPNLLKLAHAAAQSSNHKEAYDYFTRVLELDGSNSDAWSGKAEAAGLMSSQHTFRMPEMLTYFRNAIEAAPEQNRTAIQHRAANAICRVITADYLNMRNGLSPKFWEIPTWSFFKNRVRDLFGVLEEANKVIPGNRSILQTLIWFCDNNRERLNCQSSFNGKQMSVAFDTEWNSWIDAQKVLHIENLYNLDPSMRPSADHGSNALNPQTNRKQVLLIVAGFILLSVLLIGLALNQSNTPTRKTTSTTGAERSTRDASGEALPVTATAYETVEPLTTERITTVPISDRYARRTFKDPKQPDNWHELIIGRGGDSEKVFAYFHFLPAATVEYAERDEREFRWGLLFGKYAFLANIPVTSLKGDLELARECKDASAFFYDGLTKQSEGVDIRGIHLSVKPFKAKTAIIIGLTSDKWNEIRRSTMRGEKHELYSLFP